MPTHHGRRERVDPHSENKSVKLSPVGTEKS